MRLWSYINSLWCISMWKIRALCVLALMLLLTVMGSWAQPPAPTEPQSLPYQRTAEDIEAAAKLMAGYDPRYTVPYTPRDAPSNGISQYVTPRTIRIGLTGYVSCSAWVNAGQPVNQVIEMPFNEYVKNVLPNEWIYTWHPESLKAGAVAAKTFAWWKMTLRGTVWQRPAGADVVDNTCDQMFIRNSRRTSTDAAVDQTWHFRMSRNNRIIGINYLDTDDRCTSYGWEDCMGQWGSQYKAQDGWTFDQILRYYYDPIDINETRDTPANVNILRNGTFDQGMESWYSWGSIEGVGVYNGALGFYRSSGGVSPAIVLQDMDYQVYINSVMAVNLLLGNSSSSVKTVTIHLHDVDNWTGVLSCQFALPPNMPLRPYRMTGTTSTYWRAVRLEISSESADGLASQLVDNVSVQYLANESPGVGTCVEPKPDRPVITSPLSGQYPPNIKLTIKPGMSTNLPGQQSVFRIQIASAPDFANILYDNFNTMTPQTSYDLTLEAGDYAIRVRQRDADGRNSSWSLPVSVAIRNYPGKALPMTPLGSNDGNTIIFSWSPTVYTDTYRVQIQTPQRTILLNKVLTPAEANCSETLCSISASALGVDKLLLDNVNYRWRVRSANAYAVKNSVWMGFSADMPGVPQIISPANNSISEASPVFTWVPVSAADKYIITVRNPDGTRAFRTPILAATVCDGSVCTLRLSDYRAALPAGTYTWSLQANRKTPFATSITPTMSFTVEADPLPAP